MGALEVGEAFKEVDAVATAAKGGQHSQVLDRITVQRSDPVGAARAPDEEMVYMRRLKVFESATEGRAREVTGRSLISVRWVHTNPGDAHRPRLCNRLVAQDTQRVSTSGPQDVASVFAAMPPDRGIGIRVVTRHDRIGR